MIERFAQVFPPEHPAMAATGRALPAAAPAPRVAVRRLAVARDSAEARAFDAIREGFLLEVEQHMDAGHGIAGAAQQPDHLFATLMEIAVLAERERVPQPHPWFLRFCRRMLDEEEGSAPTPEDSPAH